MPICGDVDTLGDLYSQALMNKRDAEVSGSSYGGGLFEINGTNPLLNVPLRLFSLKGVVWWLILFSAD